MKQDRTGKWPIEIDGLPFLKMVIFYRIVILGSERDNGIIIMDNHGIVIMDG
jgi:hypothetical protein